ncbi:MAG: hypothetical protein K0R09_3510, partial [Clostridiales bacterium]|nr:hypothetical protein [Clostridiales bacterium]
MGSFEFNFLFCTVTDLVIAMKV